MKLLFVIFLSIFFGNYIGWVRAHIVIAAECQKLGGFYVGKTVYKCNAIVDGGNLTNKGGDDE